MLQGMSDYALLSKLFGGHKLAMVQSNLDSQKDTWEKFVALNQPIPTERQIIVNDCLTCGYLAHLLEENSRSTMFNFSELLHGGFSVLLDMWGGIWFVRGRLKSNTHNYGDFFAILGDRKSLGELATRVRDLSVTQKMPAGFNDLWLCSVEFLKM